MGKGRRRGVNGGEGKVSRRGEREIGSREGELLTLGDDGWCMVAIRMPVSELCNFDPEGLDTWRPWNPRGLGGLVFCNMQIREQIQSLKWSRLSWSPVERNFVPNYSTSDCRVTLPDHSP